MGRKRTSTNVSVDTQDAGDHVRRSAPREVLVVGEVPVRLRTALIARGANLTLLNRSGEALQLLAERDFDVVVVDPNLDGGGVAFVQAIKPTFEPKLDERRPPKVDVTPPLAALSPNVRSKRPSDRQVEELRRAIDGDPRDVKLLQRLARVLQERREHVSEADVLMRLAAVYAHDGFFLKAVAMYKQVIKLDPSRVLVNLELAEMHVRLQLVGEACEYLEIVAMHFELTGTLASAVELRRRQIELLPLDATWRRKLGSLYERAGLRADVFAGLTASCRGRWPHRLAWG